MDVQKLIFKLVSFSGYKELDSTQVSIQNAFGNVWQCLTYLQTHTHPFLSWPL